MATDVTPTDTARRLSTRTTVGEVMRPPATSVEAHGHLAAAAYLLRHAGERALVVTTDDEERRPIAVITSTDISRAVADGRDPENTRIEELWTADPVTVAPDLTVDQAARTMLMHRFHHLPVVDGGRLVGIVDMSDVCRALLPEETRP